MKSMNRIAFAVLAVGLVQFSANAESDRERQERATTQGLQNTYNQSMQNSGVDTQAQQQVLQNQNQINMNGSQGMQSVEGQQYIDMGQSQQGTTLNSMTSPTQQQTQQQQPVASSGGSAGSAKGAQMMQLLTVGAGVAAGAALASPCASGPPQSGIACPMMALSLAQSAMSLLSSGGSGRSANQFSTSSGTPNWNTTSGDGLNRNYQGGEFGNVNNTGDGTNGTSGNRTPEQIAMSQQMGQLTAEYDRLKGIVDKAGYTVSPDGKTMTMPDGKQVPTSAFSSPEGMRAAGFSDAQIEAMMNAQKAAGAKANERIRGIAMAVEGGAGGGGMGPPSGGAGAGSGRGGYGGYGFRMPRAAGAAQPKVSGLSRQLGNDRIGLAGDDIFQMITIRYNERDRAGNFKRD